MTGKNTPRRHIESQRVKGYKLDADVSALLFRERVINASLSSTLHPYQLVKALGPNLKNEGSGGTRDKVAEEELILPMFDPQAKRKPGQVLKLHFSYDELMRDPDGPHFGWVDPPQKTTPLEDAQNIRQALRDYAKNPDPLIVGTASRLNEEKSLYGAIHVKALGQTLRQMNPRGVIDLAGAIARGVIVDADGKMRCPPGTPNANQFTDEFMTNCFAAPSAGGLRRLGRNFAARLNQLEMEGRNIRLLRTAPQRAEQAKENYATQAERAQATAARLQRVKDAVERLAPGASAEFNEDYVSALVALHDNGLGPEVKNLFTGGAMNPDGTPFEWNDSLSARENLQRFNDAIVDTYSDMIIMQDYGNRVRTAELTGQDPGSFDDFKRNMTPAQLASVKKAAEQLAERHQAALRGFMESFIDLSETDPDKMKFLGQIRSFAPGKDVFTGEGFQGWIDTDGMMESPGMGLGTDDNPEILFNPYSLVLRPILKGNAIERLGEGEYLTFTPNNASAADARQASATADFISRTIEDARFLQEMAYAREVSASLNNDPDDALSFIRLKASHVAYHEFGHVLQYAQASEKIQKMVDRDGQFTIYGLDENGQPKVEKVISGPVSSWSSRDWGDAVSALHRKYIGPDDDFPPVNAVVLEESMTHVLSGQYYQNEVKNALGLPVGTDERIARVKLAVNEATVELYALKRMGILRGDDIDKATGWLDEPVGVEPKQRRPIPPQTQEPGITGAGWFSPVFGGRERPTPEQKVAADEGRRIAVSQDATVPGLLVPSSFREEAPSNPLSPSGTESPWSGISRLILSDPDTGISDDSPSSRPSQRIAANSEWVDSIFGLSADQGSGMSISDMDAETLDARYESVEDIANRLIGMESLSADDQAKLWSAVQEMSNIVNENNTRRRRDARERRRAEARGLQTQPGRFVSQTSGAESEEAVSGTMVAPDGSALPSEIIDNDLLIGIKRSIGEHFKSSNGNKDRGAPGYAPDLEQARSFGESAGAIRRERLREAHARQAELIGDDGIADFIAGKGIDVNVRFPSAISHPLSDFMGGIREVKSRSIDSFLADSGQVARNEMPTPDSPSSSIVREIDEVLIPSLERLDGAILDEDVEVLIPMSISPDGEMSIGELSSHGMITARISNAPGDLPGTARRTDETPMAKVILRSGDRGALVTNEDGEVVGVTLPPGSFAVTEIDSDGRPIGIVSNQQTSSDYVASTLAKIETSAVDENLRGEINQIKASLQKYEQEMIQKTASSGPPQRGVDPVPSRQRAGVAKTIAVRDALAKSGSSPFNPPNKSENVAAAKQKVNELVSLADDLAKGRRTPQNDAELDLRDRLSKMGSDQVENIANDLSEAVLGYFNSLSDQPRIALDSNDLQKLVDPTTSLGNIAPTGQLLDGSPNPFAMARIEAEEKHGFTPDAPFELRPMPVSIVSSKDLERADDYLESLPTSSIQRQADNLSDSSEFSLTGDSDAIGKFEVVLSPATSNRTVVSVGGIDGPGSPAMLSGSSQDELIAALLPFGDAGVGETEALSAILDIISESKTGGDISRYLPGLGENGRVQGLITGGISRSDIDSVRIPIESVPGVDSELSPQDIGFDSREQAVGYLLNLGLTVGSAESVLDEILSPNSDFEATRIIRESRAARAEKSKYGDLSSRISVTNKDGIDVTDSRSFASLPYAAPDDDLDSILAKKVKLDLSESAKSMAKAKRSPRNRPSEQGRAQGSQGVGSRSRTESPIAAKAPASTSTSRVYKDTEVPAVEDIQPDGDEYAQEVIDAARALREKMDANEAEVTEALIDVASVYDGTMEGLEFRLKATKGLAKKISNYMNQGLTLEQAVAKVKDSLRYTMSLDEEQYVMGLFAALKSLENKGHGIAEIKNYWDDGDAYQGINVVIRHPDGFLYELQFHTPMSFEVKQANHDMYDEFQKETDPEKRYDLFIRMSEAASQIPKPAGELLDIGTRIREEVEAPNSVKSIHVEKQHNFNQTRAVFGNLKTQRTFIGSKK